MKCCSSWSATSSNMCCSPAHMPSVSLTVLQINHGARKKTKAIKSSRVYAQSRSGYSHSVEIDSKHLQSTASAWAHEESEWSHEIASSKVQESLLTLFEREIWSNLPPKHFLFFLIKFHRIASGQRSMKLLWIVSSQWWCHCMETPQWSVQESYVYWFWESWCQASYP